MFSLDHYDFGTPSSEATELRHPRDRRPRRDSARRHVGDACSGDRSHADSQTLRDRYAQGLRLVPSLPGRNRRSQRISGVLHHRGRAGDEGQDAERDARPLAPRRHGALSVRPSGRARQRPEARAHRDQGDGAESRLYAEPLWRRWRSPRRRVRRRQQSLFPVRSQCMHRVLAVRARVR